MHAIEKGIPVPPPRKSWPWAQMAVGDCVAIGPHELGDARNSAYACARRKGRKFTIRKIDAGAWAVWRVA